VAEGKSILSPITYIWNNIQLASLASPDILEKTVQARVSVALKLPIHVSPAQASPLSKNEM
jgi:hypothetical protein